jgi:hypothetical protein
VKTFDELRESKTVDLQEASTKVKTTMPDKVASSATRFGLKSKSQGGHVSISGPKGKLNDFLRAIIGRSSYGNASELSESVEMNEETALAYQTPYGTATAYKRDTKGMRGKQDGYKLTLKTKSGKTVDLGSHPNPTKANVLSIVKNVMQKESVEEAYRKPTAAEIAADKAKERRASGSKGPDSSARYKNIKKKMYGNAMGGLKKEESDLTEALVKVTDVEFDYRDQLPNSPKTSDLGAIKDEWKKDRVALRNAVKKMGGLVTNTVSPSRGNRWVGTVTIGTREDPSKLDDKSIQKAVKSHGIEIHDKQFRESTNLEEKYAVKYTHPTDKKSGRTTGPMSKAAADKKAAMGNKVDKVGGKYTVIRHVEEVTEAKLSDMGIHNKIADRNLLIKAIKTAEKMGGNMTGAVREIEKMKKGLSKHKAVQAALRQANESVELGESVDFMKMSKELLKHKSKGIEFEKAAAYVRAIHNNSSVQVQDKAFMGLTKMLKDMDDFTKKTTITKILKDNGFKVRGGKLMREEVELLDENYRTLATHGMGAETKNSINVGRDVDYYEPKNGDKRMGKITKMTRSGYVVKDEKDGKSHTFAFYDRVKSKEIMAKSK